MGITYFSLTHILAGLDLLHAAKQVSNDNYSHFTETIRQIWIASALYNGPQF